jgi:tripartite-type tricarboxylate transporter receptor subunit TctC
MRRHPTRREAMLATVGSLALPASIRAAQAADAPWPSAPIRFIIPTAVGGGHDTMMRVLGQKLTEKWGQPCITESKAGATGAIAATYVAKTPPDHHTFLVGYSAFLSNTLLQPNPGYRVADFTPVNMLVLTPIGLGVRESLGVKTLQEFVDLAKSKPGKLTYGSYGQGSGGHFVMELLSMTAGIELIHLPYKGEAPAVQDLLGGQIDATVVTVGAVSRYPGKIRALGVCSPQRSPLYPEVPTFAEAGFGQVDMPGWGGLFAPAATPRAIVDKLSAELSKVVVMPDVSPKLLQIGFEPAGWPTDRTTEFMKQQLALTQQIVSSGRVKL